VKQNIAVNSPPENKTTELDILFFGGLPGSRMAGEKCVIIIYKLGETHCSKYATFMYKDIYILKKLEYKFYFV
jgi:hypothetical protein